MFVIFLNGVSDRPMTYLYNTLHYYEKRLKDRPPLKKKLVSAIIGMVCSTFNRRTLYNVILIMRIDECVCALSTNSHGLIDFS